MRRFRFWFASVLGIAVLSVGGVSWAQQQTTTSSEMRSFEIISVDGYKVIVRGQQGTQEVTVNDEFRLTVDGKPVSVKELRPGMKGTARITTTTTVTPVVVTEIKSAEVVQVAGGSITVRGPNGFQMFSEGEVAKRGVKIFRDGKPLAFSELRRGDRLTATIVTESAPKVVTQRDVDAMMSTGGGAAAAPTGATAARATAPPSAPAASPSAAASPRAAQAPAPSAADSGRQLPKTASPIPLVGILGVVSLVAGAVLTARRRRLL